MSDFSNGEGLGPLLDDEAVNIDEEILQNESGLAELLDGGNASGQVRHTVQTGDLAVLRGGVDSTEVVNQASVEWDKDGATKREVERLWADIEARLAGATVDAVRVTPEKSADLVHDMANGMETINNMRLSPVATELAIIQRAAQVPLFTAAREQAAFNIGVRNRLIEALDEQGLLDKTLDVLGMFVPARTAIEWGDVKAGIDSDMLLSKYLTGDSISGAVTSFQSLPLEHMELIWPTLSDVVMRASGLDTDGTFTDPNMLLATGMLMAFLEPEGGERAAASVRVDLAIELLAGGPAALKSIAKIRKARKLSHQQAAMLPPRTDKVRVVVPQQDVAFAPQAVLDDISAQVNTQPTAIKKAMESVLLSSGELAVKEHNIIKVLAKAGDTKEAARINMAAMSDSEIARSIGLTSDEAVQNAMPWQTNDWLPQVTKGIVPDMGKALNDFYRAASKQVADVTTEATRMRIGATYRNDRANQIKTFEQELDQVGEDILSDGYTISDAKITGENTEAFTFEYTITDNLGGERTLTGRRSWVAGRIDGDYTATVDDLAQPSASDTPGASPAAWSKTKAEDGTDFNDAVKLQIQQVDLKAAVFNDVAELWILANKPVAGIGKGKLRDQLNALDIEGDEFINPTTQEVGKVFLPQELQAKGIQDTRVIEAYYNRRLMADAMHGMQNYGVRRELELTGFNRSIIVGQGETSAQLFVKAYDDVNAARSALAGKEAFRIYDPTTGKTFTATQTHIDSVYADGRQIVRSNDDFNISGNDLDRSAEHVEYVAVQRVDVRALPEQVIHYKAGYVPKRNEGIEHVVQRNFPVFKGGDDAASKQEAMRAFVSKLDAENFRADLAVKHAAKHNISIEEANKLYVLADGSVMSQINRANASLGSSKGLFKGTRAKDELLMGLEGRSLQRMQPEEVMGRWLDHVAGGATGNELRIGKEQEWINTVRRTLDGVQIKGFNGTELPNTEQGKALEKLRNQITNWNSIPSRRETLFEVQMQNTHDWILNGSRKFGYTGDSLPGSSIIDLGAIKGSPEWLSGKAKTVSMHLMLGNLNPAQIVVQASALTVAASLADPKTWPSIVKRTAQLSAFDLYNGTGGYAKTVRRQLGEMDVPADIKELANSWNRSGLREGMLGNADLNYTSSAGIGFSSAMLKKYEGLSLAFYRAGEITNRRVSYITAFDNWKVKNPGKKIDDAAESDILRDANLYMLELNSANRAWFQGGAGAGFTQQLVSTATQFMQVLTKSGELAAKGPMRGGFTSAQKGRIALGQLAFYGSAGVPILGMIGPAVVDAIKNSMGDELTPDQLESLEVIANGINAGGVGFFTREIVGADVEVSGRAGLALGVIRTIGDIFTAEDPAWQRLLGPSFTSGERIIGAAKQLSILGEASEMFRSLESIEPMLLSPRAHTQNLNRSDLLATMKDIGLILATIPTTGRNILKANIMRTQGQIISRKGTVRIRDDFNAETEMGVALGFQPTAESRLRHIEEIVFANKDHMNDAVGAMMQIYHRYVFLHNRGAEYGQTVINAKQIIEESFNNPKLVQDFNSRLEARILGGEGKTAQDRALAEFFKTVLPEETTEGYIIDQGGVGNPLSTTPVVLPFHDTQSAPEVGD